jgi:3-hydroxybutyryl-CoA dehydratase
VDLSAVRPGDALPGRSFGPTTVTDFVRFAGAGGDFNPLHHDESVAAAAGLQGIIAMGQFQAGLLAALLSDWAGVRNVASFGVRFLRAVHAGDVIDLSGSVTAIDLVAGTASVALTARVAAVDVAEAKGVVWITELEREDRT